MLIVFRLEHFHTHSKADLLGTVAIIETLLTRKVSSRAGNSCQKMSPIIPENTYRTCDMQLPAGYVAGVLARQDRSGQAVRVLVGTAIVAWITTSGIMRARGTATDANETLL